MNITPFIDIIPYRNGKWVDGKFISIRRDRDEIISAIVCSIRLIYIIYTVDMVDMVDE